jgi:hypothetical protein
MKILRTLTLLLLSAVSLPAPEIAGPWLGYDIPSQTTTWHVDAALPRFNPAVDQVPGYLLARVEYVIQGGATSTYHYENTSLGPADVTLTLAVTLDLSGRGTSS